MKITLYIICALVSGSLYSQNLSDYIPRSTTYLFSVNFGQLNAKSKDMSYAQYLKPFLKGEQGYYDGRSENADCDILNVNDLVQDPSGFGIDLQTSVYVYRSSIKDIAGTVYLFRLGKPEGFEARLKTSCAGKPVYMIQKRHVGQAIIYVSESMSVAINGNVALIFKKDYSYNYVTYEYSGESPNGYADSAYLAETRVDNRKQDSLFYERLNNEKNMDYEKEQESYLQKSDTSILSRALQREETRKLAIINEQYNVIFDLVAKLIIPQQENMSSDRSFMKIDQGKHDAYVFLHNLSNLNSDLFNPFRRSRYYDYPEDANLSKTRRVLTEDISSSYTIDFEDGKATMRVLSSYNKHVYPYLEKAYDVKQDKKLFKYIHGENLLGYMSVAVNAKELARFYEDFYREMLANFPKRESDHNLYSAMELFYAMLDKEMLFNSLNGRSILACTGFADIKVKYSTYDYDDEFRKTERVDERIEKQPSMVWVSAIGNMENAKKLFNIISGFTVFTKLRENVFVFYGNHRTPFNIYFALTEDAFIMTNDANLALNNLEGHPKNKQMPKSEQKFISQHNLVFKIYSQKMLEGVKDTYFRNGETLPWFTQLMANLGDIEMYDSKPGENSYEAIAVISLKDHSSNSLYQLLKVMSSVNER